MSGELHRDLVVFDGLIISNWSREVFEDMQRGGVGAANCTCAVWEGFRGTMENIAQWQRWFAEYDDILVLAHQWQEQSPGFSLFLSAAIPAVLCIMAAAAWRLSRPFEEEAPTEL